MHQTREQWLEAAVVELTPLFKEIGVELPPVRVSVGWPSHGGTGATKKVVGQCWKKSVAKDGVAQIFISPLLEIEALGVLVHELIHAYDDCESGHQGQFARIARAIGLVGKLTVTTVGDELAEKLKVVLQTLGEYPHSPLDPAEMVKQKKPQKTRMLKLHAPDCCGYIVRTTAKWIDEGLPSCPHGTEMEIAD